MAVGVKMKVDVTGTGMLGNDGIELMDKEFIPY